MSGIIKQLKNVLQTSNIFPVTLTRAVYDDNNKSLSGIIGTTSISSIGDGTLTGAIKKISTISGGDTAFKVIAQDGTGDFTTITAAVNSYDEGDEVCLILKEGIYDEVVNVNGKFKNFIMVGTNKGNCIIRNTTGVYKNSPFLISGNFHLENICFEMTLDNVGSWTPTYNDSDVYNTYPGYALHIDSNSYDTSTMSYGVVKSCIMQSEAFPAVGMGVNYNQTVEFEDNIFSRNCANTAYRKDNWRGSFLCHCATVSGSGTQLLILRNNSFYSNYGYAAHIRGNLSGSSQFIVEAVGNMFSSAELGYRYNSMYYEQGNSILAGQSKGNNSDNLNYDGCWKLVYEDYNIDSHSSGYNGLFGFDFVSAPTEYLIEYGLSSDQKSFVNYWQTSQTGRYSDAAYGRYLYLRDHDGNDRGLLFSIGLSGININNVIKNGFSGYTLGIRIYVR